MSRSRLVEFSVRRPWAIIITSVALTLLSLLALPRVVIDTDPENMLRASEPVRVIHSQIKEEFNLSDFLVVGFVNKSDPVLTAEFAEKLAELIEFVESIDGVVSEDIIAPSTVDDIYQNSEGALVVDNLMYPRAIEGQQPTLAERINQNPILTGKLASQDGRALAMYIPLEEKKFAREVADAIEAEMARIGGFPYAHITGLPVAEETFGGEMFKQMAVSAPMAGGLIFLLLLFFFRKIKVIIAPMIVAMMTVIITMGSLIAAGFTVHIMSSMIAIFLMPIAVLDSVHIISEFHDRYQSSKSAREAILTTMDHLYKPMLFTSLTTFVGFASLMMADIPPVRIFGAFVAIGVGLAWLLSVTFIPAFSVLLSEKSLRNFGAAEEDAGLLGRVLPRIGSWAVSRKLGIAIMAALVFGVAVYGVTKIIVNDNPTRWFKPDHPIRVAEAELKGPLAGTYLAYLKFDGSESETGLARTPEIMGYIEKLQNHLLTKENVGGVTGVTDIIKKVRYELHGADSSYYALPDSETEIAQELFLYEISGGDPEDLYKFITPDGESALLWLQLKEGDNQAVAGVVDAVDEFIETNPPPTGLAYSWAGLSYINIIWQKKMVSGMANALAGSGIVVGLMMIFLLRSILLGLLSLVPLTLTIATVYGAVGFWGKAYDMPIAVLSALALGLSVDFAIHFLKRGQEIARTGVGISATLTELFGEPFRAITRNIIVIALGFTPLLFSSLMPYVTVGSFFLAIMAISGVATLIILPALVKLRGEKAFRSWGGDKPAVKS